MSVHTNGHEMGVSLNDWVSDHVGSMMSEGDFAVTYRVPSGLTWVDGPSDRGFVRTYLKSEWKSFEYIISTERRRNRTCSLCFSLIFITR